MRKQTYKTQIGLILTVTVIGLLLPGLAEAGALGAKAGVETKAQTPKVLSREEVNRVIVPSNTERPQPAGMASTRNDAPNSWGVRGGPDNLILWHRFEDEPADGVEDSSSYGNDGICTSCPTLTTDAKEGSYAYQFNRGQYYGLGDATGTELEPDLMTIAFWVKILSGEGRDVILGQSGPIFDSTGYAFYYNGDQQKIRFAVGHFDPADPYNDGLKTYVKSKERIEPGRWYHIAGKWDGENLSLYVNGRLSYSNPYYNMGPDSAVPVSYDRCEFPYVGTGVDPWGGAGFCSIRSNLHSNIILDDLRFYNIPLSDEEISELAVGADGPADSSGYIEASRTSGVTPLAVFFDAISDFTWEEIESSEFIWDFGDGSPEFKGYMAAHVFELNETDPQTEYTVTLTIKQNGSVVASDTETITVSPFTGTTYCVSQSSNWQGCPSGAIQETSLDTAWNNLNTNTRILLRRGEEWITTGHTKDRVAGPVIIGAYGQGNKPKVIVSIGAPFQATNSADWRFVDLHIVGGTKEFGAECSYGGSNCTNLLILRIDMQDVQANRGIAAPSLGLFVIDSTFRNFTRYGSYYYMGENIAYLNNIYDEVGSHVLRIGGSEKLIVHSNILSDPGSGAVTHDVLTIRGGGTISRHSLISNNFFLKPGWLVQNGPQNAKSTGGFQYMIIDGNTFGPYPGGASSGNGLLLDGYDVSIRNNIFYNVGRAIHLSLRDRFVGDTRRVNIYNNDAFISPGISGGNFVKINPSNPEHIRIYNNIYSRSSGSTVLDITSSGAMSQIFSDYNIWHGTNNNFYVAAQRYDLATWRSLFGQDLNSDTLDPEFLSTDPASPDFLKLASTSPAIDTGASVPVWEDFDNNPRPIDGDSSGTAEWDIGAYEYALLTLPGDFDEDGDVDMDDYAMFEEAYTGANRPVAPGYEYADLDGDGDVDLDDFSIFAANYTG